MGTCIPAATTKRRLRQLFPPRSRGSSCKQHELVFERLPVDIIHRIHSFLPLKDAARAACVSRVFMRSWRCYSNLTLNTPTLGMVGNQFRDTVDHILEKHSGIGVEIFRLDLRFCADIGTNYLARWLQNVAHSRIKELTLVAPARLHNEYNFPCSVLCDESAASSIWSLDLHGCTFCPTAAFGCLRRLRLCFVNITEERLGHLLSTSFALEHMDIIRCSKIICLRIPCTLHKLAFLKVESCHSLQSLDISAPNLSTFHCVGTLVKDISVADPWQLKDVYLSCSSPYHTLSHAPERLSSIAQNVESVYLFSLGENFNTPMLVPNFPRLRKLEINIQSPQPAFSFDVLSLVSFLDASPALDSFILHVGNDALRHDVSFSRGDNGNYLMLKPPCQHTRLRQVRITGFRSNKNLSRFVIYIVESAPSLENLTLDTTAGDPRKCGIIGNREGCSWMKESTIREAHRAVKVAKRYIKKRVASGVRFQVLKPCSRCHTRRWWHM